MTALHWTHATMTGGSHRGAGEPCQDASGSWRVGDVLVAAVADGLGSYQESQIGSSAAIECVAAHREEVAALAAGAPPEQVQDLLQTIFFAWWALCDERQNQRPTTLLIAALGPAGTIAMQLGDGQVWAWWDQGELLPLSPPTVGGAGTEHLAMSDAYERFRIYRFREDPPSAIFMMTDGLEMAVAEGKETALVRFLLEKGARMRQETWQQLLRQVLETLTRDGDDDKTLAILWRREEG